MFHAKPPLARVRRSLSYTASYPVSYEPSGHSMATSGRSYFGTSLEHCLIASARIWWTSVVGWPESQNICVSGESQTVADGFPW